MIRKILRIRVYSKSSTVVYHNLPLMKPHLWGTDKIHWLCNLQPQIIRIYKIITLNIFTKKIRENSDLSHTYQAGFRTKGNPATNAVRIPTHIKSWFTDPSVPRISVGEIYIFFSAKDENKLKKWTFGS